MATSTSITVRAIDQASAPLNKIGKSLKKLGDPVGLRRVTRSLDNLKRSALGISKVTGAFAIGGAVGIGAILSPSVKLQRSLNNVRKRLKDVAETDSDFVALEGIIKNIGRTTELTANQAAQGAQFMAQAGLSAAQINKGLGHVVDLQIGAGDNAELKETADIMTDIGSVFFKNNLADKMQTLADVMAHTTSATNTDLIQLGEAFKYGSAHAKQAGQTLETTAALAGALANVGLKGSIAGTGMKRFFLALSQEKNDKLFKGLKIDVFDKDDNFREATDIISDLSEKMKDMTEREKSVTLSKIFGNIGFSSAAAFIDGADALKKLKDEIDNSAGAAKRMREITQSDLLGSFRSSLSALEGLLVSVGQKFHEPLKKIARYITAVINKITAWVDKNPKLVKMIGIIAGIGVALLGVTAIVAGFIAAFAGIVAVFVKFGIVAGAIAVKVLAVTTAFGALVKMRQYLIQFKNTMSDLANPLERLAYLWMKMTGKKTVWGYQRDELEDKVEDGRQVRKKIDNAKQEGKQDHQIEKEGFAGLIRKRQAEVIASAGSNQNNPVQFNQNVNINNAPAGTRVEKGEGDNLEITIPLGEGTGFIGA